MKTRSELFLWIHLGGIIIFPLLLAITLIGLAVGERYSYLLELPLITASSILPILLMQLYRPFNIFSVLFVALKAESLTNNQKKILALFQRKGQKIANIIAAILMSLSLWLLYYFSPMVADLAHWLPQQRILGLAIAIVAFFGSNLFLQIPLNALQVLLANELTFAQVEQCTSDEIEHDFTSPGIKVSQMLWLDPSNIETEKIKL